MTSAIGSRGFTLIELLVVLAILVLLSAAWPLAAPRLFPAQQLRNETQRLVNALRIARTAAQVTGTVRQMEVLTSGTAYRVAEDSHDLPRGFTLRLRDDEVYANRRVIRFFADGSSTGGALALALADRSNTVLVGRLTGRAQIAD